MHDRIKEVIKRLHISQRKFSIGLGNSHAWVSLLLSSNKDSLKAKDLLEMERVYNVNPLYILKGSEPMFLEESK